MGSAVSSATPSPPADAPRPARILVAEDDVPLRSLIAAALRGAGFEVVEAGDGVECVGYAQPWVFRGHQIDPPDLIVSDIRMPGWSGIEALRIFQAGAVRAPVVLMTAFGTEETHELAARLGAAHVFDKPFAIDDLVAVVRELLTLADLADHRP
jgi:DNA-binding response OmpR family regulator